MVGSFDEVHLFLHFCRLSGSTMCFHVRTLPVLHWFVWLVPLVKVVDCFVISMLCCSMVLFGVILWVCFAFKSLPVLSTSIDSFVLLIMLCYSMT